jgi:hypothetical protein
MSRFGSIGTQYFDDSGKPLSGGSLTFSESGTNTAKATYSDADQAIANTNPVVLDASGRQPDIYFNGSARCILADRLGAQVEVRDPVGSATGKDAFSDWNALITYDIEDIVQGSDDAYYQSNLNSNLANDPTSEPTKWQEVRFVAVWNADYTYPAGALVVEGGGAFYRCINGNLGDTPSTTPAEWATIGGSGMNDIFEDKSPQQGANLDVNGFAIVSVTDGDIPITPHGTGEVPITRPEFIGVIKLPGTWTIEMAGDHMQFKFGGTAVFEFSDTGTFKAIEDAGKAAI